MPSIPTESTSFARNSVPAVRRRRFRLIGASHKVISVWRTALTWCAALRIDISGIELGAQDG